jgi:AcrR family transcriptional regulator
MITNTQNSGISDRESEILSDRKSEIKRVRRGRPSVPAALVLAAANGLFAAADSPRTVTMDAIAAAAGVGKGTLFRAFGSREGLLDALWAAKLAALRGALEGGAPPLGPGGAPRERAVAFLDALLTFKLENRHLIRAREIASAGLRQSEHYRWMHGLLGNLIKEAASGAAADEAGYSAHVLLGALHIDLIEEMLATGRSSSEIRSAQAALARAVIDDARLA